MNVQFIPTPYRTVHASVTVPTQDTAKARRSIASQAGHRKLGKRLTIREHQFGPSTTLYAIYSK